MQNETELDCQVTKENPFGCVELWAGNELAHRHVELVGLEGDLIAVPSDSKVGGDFYALFSCGADRAARIVLADSVGRSRCQPYRRSNPQLDSPVSRPAR